MPIVAPRVPQFSDIAAISFKQSIFLNNFINKFLYFQGCLFTKASADLLGGLFGFYRKSNTKNIQGTVTMIASQNKRFLTYSTVPLQSLISNPGIEAPRVIDNKLNNIPVKPIVFTFYDRNQLMAILLGVFRIKMLPIAASAEPIKQKIEFPLFNNNRNHTPLIKKEPPTKNPTRIPCLLMSQLQGNANTGWAIVNSNAFSVTQSELISKIRQTATLMLEKVCTGIELTMAAAKQAKRMTNLYFSQGYCFFSIQYQFTLQFYRQIRSESIHIRIIFININTVKFNHQYCAQ